MGIRLHIRRPVFDDILNRSRLLPHLPSVLDTRSEAQHELRISAYPLPAPWLNLVDHDDRLKYT